MMGWGTNYNNTGFDGAWSVTVRGVGGQGFMRRKDNLWQWFSPNWGGTANARRLVEYQQSGLRSETRCHRTVDGSGQTHEIDPQILSIGIAYTTTINETDELWVALGYQQHDEFAAASFDNGSTTTVMEGCSDSDDETIRYAARYIHDWGNGHSTRTFLGL